MKKNIVLAVIVAAFAMLVFTSVTFFALNRTAFADNTLLLVLNVIIIILAPLGGGYLAGLIAKQKHQLVGLISGISAGVVLSALALIFSDTGLVLLLPGVLLALFWGLLARFSATWGRK